MRTVCRRVVTLLAAAVAIAALAVPMVAGAGTGIGVRAKAASNLCANADSLPTKLTTDQAQATTLCLINAQRTARGLRPLRSHPTLDRIATDFARQMAERQFFDHLSPDGSTLLSRVKSTGYLTRVSGWSLAENIAWGTGDLSTARATVQGWMKSPPHRANLLSSQYIEVGIGLADGGATADVNPKRRGTTYVTDFGKRAVRADSAKQHR